MAAQPLRPQEAVTAQALAGFRVVELAERVAGEYCGKLLADFGAEVIKVERPGTGSPTRRMSPVLGAGTESSGLFAYANTNKRSVALDTADRAALHALIATADAVVDDHAASWRESIGLARTAVEADHPGVVFCSATPFGAQAPDRLRNATSLNIFQAGGWGHHTPGNCDPEAAPLQGPGRFVADYEAGLDAALCVASALFGKLHRRAGEFIDLSQQAVLASRADCVLGRFLAGEVTPEGARTDFDQQGPASFFTCADGAVYLYMTNRNHWRGLRALLEEAAWLDEFDENWLEFDVSADKVAAFRAGFARSVAARSRAELTERAQKLGVALVPVNDAADLKQSAQYRHRGFFQRVTHPTLGAADYPTVPYRLSRTPARITRCAPELGEYTTTTARGSVREPVPPRFQRPRSTRGGPLAGVRVVELGKVWAAPYAGKLLAFLGAEVIKVESRDNPDEMRAYGGTDIDHAPYFLSINPEILSVEIDMKSPTGADRLRELIARSDIVIENLRPGAMARLDLTYEALTAIKPDIIAVSIKMWGTSGPLSYQTGYAPCFAALSGAAASVGRPGGPPLGANSRYGDSTVGAAAAFAAVTALLHRELTGEGQFVDVSAVETLSTMIGDRLLEHGLTGQPLAPVGNRHPDLNPHGCYRCADGWVSIAVADDRQWRQLTEVLDAPNLTADSRFANNRGRSENSDELDEAITRHTLGHAAEDLARRLSEAGVPATKSATAPEIIGDRGLWDREFYRFVSDHREGLRPILGAPWRMSRSEAEITRGAPCLGEHDAYVLAEILSSPTAAIDGTP
ncbi:CaiB/BaiF CoA transferase family protein [Nocardia bovistercoris]|uniref:CoA transferase n=1 Tax=Nocardia bovistercoris TaxID=2785916 RepID=A0A931IFZ0_9NOCA|nr:CoA transferase [Nocardia bovistercoris]MBH0779640.1 CoA transferase [Nocardia bovistercoris]